jgi:hypothetical protein
VFNGTYFDFNFANAGCRAQYWAAHKRWKYVIGKIGASEATFYKLNAN